MKKTAATDSRTWDSAVELSHVTKYFDRRLQTSLFHKEHSRVYALKDVSFRLEKGELAAYAGPNGAGKSTTFKILAGMLCPQEGHVRILGLDPSRDRIPAMKRVGVLFGNRTELWWDHPVSASFAWKKEVWDIDDETYRQTCGELKEMLDLNDFWNAFARELSLGQRMRADLALCMLHSPELVLLDEPTLGLDVLAKKQMIAFLRRINREKKVTLMVTSHDMDDLSEMTDRIMLINKGELAFDGDYDSLIRMAGDRRILSVQADNDPGELPGMEKTGTEGGRYLYTYRADQVPAGEVFAILSRNGQITDVRMGSEPIENVIAGLYRKWKNEDKA